MRNFLAEAQMIVAEAPYRDQRRSFPSDMGDLWRTSTMPGFTITVRICLACDKRCPPGDYKLRQPHCGHCECGGNLGDLTALHIDWRHLVAAFNYNNSEKGDTNGCETSW